MKAMRVLFLFLVLVPILSVKAQDTIYMKNGEKINAKVLEVGVHDVKYKKAVNPDGPTYTSLKGEIALIEYKNGYKEVYSGTQPTTDKNKSRTNESFKQEDNGPTVIIAPRIGIGRGWGFYRPHRWRRHWCW